MARHRAAGRQRRMPPCGATAAWVLSRSWRSSQVSSGQGSREHVAGHVLQLWGLGVRSLAARAADAGCMGLAPIAAEGPTIPPVASVGAYQERKARYGQHVHELQCHVSELQQQLDQQAQAHAAAVSELRQEVDAALGAVTASPTEAVRQLVQGREAWAEERAQLEAELQQAREQRSAAVRSREALAADSSRLHQEVAQLQQLLEAAGPQVAAGSASAAAAARSGGGGGAASPISSDWKKVEELERLQSDNQRLAAEVSEHSRVVELVNEAAGAAQGSTLQSASGRHSGLMYGQAL